MAYLTLIISLMIAGVAAWYSIAGLVAIFASAVVPIVIMGGVLEVGKLATAAWLHRNWATAPLLLKTYLTTAVVVLMLITSMGIFGFLSKAHLDQSIMLGGNNELQIQNLERQIGRQRASIADAEKVLAQLDGQVETLIEYDRIRGPSGSIAVRTAQSEERQTLNQEINDAYSRIELLQEELFPLQKSRLEIEAEVGPLKYIAELIYGDEAKNHFDEAVRWIIILLVVVFDPLAITLLLAASVSFQLRRGEKITFTEMPRVDEDFGIEEVSEPEIELSDTDTEQLSRLDKRVRNKLQWLIDKQKGGSDEISP